MGAGVSETGADVLVIFGTTGDLAKVMTFRSLARPVDPRCRTGAGVVVAENSRAPDRRMVLRVPSGGGLPNYLNAPKVERTDKEYATHG